MSIYDVWTVFVHLVFFMTGFAMGRWSMTKLPKHRKRKP